MDDESSARFEVECRDVWKIFGARESEALAAARQEGIGRAEIQRRFHCVLAVAGVNLQIAEGEIFCIIGLSGSGKSTLIRHINRLIDPSFGEVRVHGQNINSLGPSALRQLRGSSIGMVFQNMALLPHRTVRDNVMLGLELRGIARDQRYAVAEEKLQQVGLQAWADHMPHELSGGMQQRVGLARAVAADPRILLMDEPFSALDPLIRRQLQDQFIELSKRLKKTTLFITHDIDEAIRIGHRIAVMRDGVIVQSGKADDLVCRPVDDYVASFVRGVSRLQVVRSHALMQTWEERHLLPPFDEALCPNCRLDTSLGDLIRLAVDQAAPIKVVDDGRAVGFITKDRLLAGIHQQSQQDGAP